MLLSISQVSVVSGGQQATFRHVNERNARGRPLVSMTNFENEIGMVVSKCSPIDDSGMRSRASYRLLDYRYLL